MQLIDSNGSRQVCDRCHRVRVKIKRGTVCESCREQDRAVQREMNKRWAWIQSYWATEDQRNAG